MAKSRTRRDAEAKVRSWGFSHVFTWTDGPNAYYPPHSHAGLTTHLILEGLLTISYPDADGDGDGDDNGEDEYGDKVNTNPNDGGDKSGQYQTRGDKIGTDDSAGNNNSNNNNNTKKGGKGQREDGKEKKVTATRTAKRYTYTAGDRIDVAAGRVHEVWMGESGCTYVVGE